MRASGNARCRSSASAVVSVTSPNLPFWMMRILRGDATLGRGRLTRANLGRERRARKRAPLRNVYTMFIGHFSPPRDHPRGRDLGAVPHPAREPPIGAKCDLVHI